MNDFSLFKDSANVFSPFLMIELLSNCMSLASMIFHINQVIFFLEVYLPTSRGFYFQDFFNCDDLYRFQEIKHFDANISLILIGAIAAISNLFLWCFFGKLATESFQNMAHCMYQANWYGLQVKLQKYFMNMIRNAQIPQHYHGLKIVIMDLETFTTVSA